MNEIEQLVKEISLLRAKSLKPRFSIQLKKRVVALTTSYPSNEISERLKLYPTMIHRWKRQLRPDNKNQFIKVAPTPTRQISSPKSFDVSISGIDVKFKSTPSPKWFAEVLREIKC